MNLKLPTIAEIDRRKPLTGRSVLIMLVAFFGVVIAVNIVMVRAAISTFGGVDTPSSYEAGLVFTAEEAAASAQDARGWKVTARLDPSASGVAATIDVRDSAGKAVTGVDVVARLAHPIDERRDVALAIADLGGGTYRGTGAAESGQWILDLDITRGAEHLFRSQNRVLIP